MGGSSKSSTSSTTNTDNRQLAVQDGVGLFSGGDANVSLSDYGAIDAGLATAENIANRSLESVDRSTGGAFEFGKRLQDEVGDTTRQAFGLVANSFEGVKNLARNAVRGDSGEVADTSKTLIYGLSAVGVIVGIYLITRGGK